MGITTAAAAQTTFPFPMENAMWSNYADHWSTSWPIEYLGRSHHPYRMYSADTVINGRIYAQLFDEFNNYAAAIRDTAGSVMVVPVDDDVEYLLYDFTIPEDSIVTLDVWMMYHGVLSITVQGLGPIGPLGRRVVQADVYQWIEGIGSTSGILMESFLNVSGYWLGLECMSHQDTVLLPEHVPGTCDEFMAVPGNPGSSAVRIGGVATDDLVLTVPPRVEGGHYTIHGMNGRIISQGSINGGDNRISTAILPAAVYMMTVAFNDGYHRARFIKVHN